MGYFRRENTAETALKRFKILTLPIFLPGDNTTLTLTINKNGDIFQANTPHFFQTIMIPISQIRTPNLLFGFRIRANTLAIGAVNNEVENQSEGRWSIRKRTVKATPICHSIRILCCIRIRHFVSFKKKFRIFIVSFFWIRSNNPSNSLVYIVEAKYLKPIFSSSYEYLDTSYKEVPQRRWYNRFLKTHGEVVPFTKLWLLIFTDTVLILELSCTVEGPHFCSLW